MQMKPIVVVASEPSCTREDDPIGLNRNEDQPVYDEHIHEVHNPEEDDCVNEH